MSDFNGWKNRATWNVALWLGNDEGLYRVAQKARSYSQLITWLKASGITHTPDGTAYADKRVSRKEMNEMLKEL